jgi:hypothetical protein
MSQRNLTPPTNLQTQVTLAGYHKYYPTNPLVAASASMAAASRGVRPSTLVQRGSPAGIMAQYPTLNGYRMTQQGPVALNTAGYIANTAQFINQAQMPVQMLQAQYQDPAAAAAASQNTMYATYGYSLMQPLNGTMRR